MYVIHNKMIWGVYREKDGWRPSSGHTDHIHISFSWNGARGNTSFWTGKLQPTDYGPCAVFTGQPGVTRSSPRLDPCPTTAGLAAQASLLDRGAGLAGDDRGGSPGGAQDQAKQDVRRWPPWWRFVTTSGPTTFPITQSLDVPTWASLIRTKTTDDVTAGYSSTRAAGYGLANYSGVTLRRNSVGRSVKFLQLALRLQAADRSGYFGPVTEAAVKKLQADAGLEQTGLATKREWSALAGN